MATRCPEQTTKCGGRNARLLALALALAAITALPAYIAGFGGATASSADPVRILLGDVRHIVSHGLLDRVEVYFHGGVRSGGCEALGHREDGGCGHTHHRHGAHKSGFWLDPWAFLNSRVHLQDHRHIAEDRFQELLPWVWAACRADPSNVQAYLMGAYIVWRKTGDARAALELLEEGLAANPRSSRLTFEAGYYHYHHLDDPAAAEARFERALELNELKPVVSDDDRLLRLRAISYLGRIAAAEGRMAEVDALWRKAREINPQHRITASLRQILQQDASVDR